MRESTIGPAGLAAEGIIAANRLSQVKKKTSKKAKKAKKEETEFTRRKDGKE